MTASGREAVFRKKLMSGLRGAKFARGGVMDLVVYQGGLSSKGTPDAHFILPGSGRAVWLEIKAARHPLPVTGNVLGHGLTWQQRRFLTRVTGLGGVGLVAVGAGRGSGWKCTLVPVHEFEEGGGLKRSELDRRVWLDLKDDLFAQRLLESVARS